MSNFGYAELQVDLKSGIKLQKVLNKFEEELGEPIDAIAVNKLHATIMYDVRNPSIFPSKSNKIYRAKVVGVKALGESGSKWGAAALVLECREVQGRFKELLNEGFKHSYDDLLVHVSMSYGETSGKILPLLEKAFEAGELPEYIVLCNETWSELED